jgi:hypothetical protein
MASITREKRGRRTIQFIGSDDKRRSIRLGKVSQHAAERILVRVEALNSAAIGRYSIDKETADWLKDIADKLHAKLAKVGLVSPREPRPRVTLDEWLTTYIAGRTDVKAWTRINLDAARRRLVDYFGADKALEKINPADADSWGIWLKGRYADGTAGRTINRAKQFFPRRRP